MGYNLTVGCHTHREQAFALRGQEARIIAMFGAVHRSSAGCVKDVAIDNGFAEKEWSEGPERYRDIHDELEERADAIGEARRA